MIYGLGLATNRPIAGLRGLPQAEKTDVCLWLGEMPSHLDNLHPDEVEQFSTGSEFLENGEPNLRVERLRAGQYLRLSYSDGTDFVIDNQYSNIWATWAETATLEDTATYLLGPVLGYLLRLRGSTCLHASAVAIGNHAIALVGPSGYGKSSTAAAFAGLGFSVLSDDVVALSERESGFVVNPAYPRVRLWPESVRGMFGSEDALPKITPSWDKRFLDLNDKQYSFQSLPLPLTAIYLLGERIDQSQDPYIETVSSREALMTILADTYATLHMDQSRRATELDVLGRIVRLIPIREVRASNDLSKIDQMCHAILDDYRLLDIATTN